MVTSITAADAADVLVVASITKRQPEVDMIPDWRHLLIQSLLVAPDLVLERVERGFEGLASAVRLYREGGAPGVEQLRQIASPTPF